MSCRANNCAIVILSDEGYTFTGPDLQFFVPELANSQIGS